MYACVADCGWITGHTYIVYGPLCNGATTVMFESIPTYPNPYRYWDLVQRHKVTQFYTAPTAGTYVTMYNILIMITAFVVWNVLLTRQIFYLFLLSHVLLIFQFQYLSALFLYCPHNSSQTHSKIPYRISPFPFTPFNRSARPYEIRHQAHR